MSTSSNASKALESLARDYWEARMSNEPLYATLLGNRRYDDRLADITTRGRAREQAQYRTMLNQLSSIRHEALANEERSTLSALSAELCSQLDYDSCGLEEWIVDPLAGPQVEFFNVESYQPIRSVEEARAMVHRWNAMGPYLKDHVANLRVGLSSGRVTVRVCVEKVLEETEDALRKADDEWAMLRPLTVPHREWPIEEQREFRDGLRNAVQTSIRPAFRVYADFLRNELLVKARPNDEPGICHLPNGSESYARLIRVHTSLDKSAQELHDRGLREVARINTGMATLGKGIFGITDRHELLSKLRSDPAMYFTTRDEVEEKARSALSRATSAIPRWFGRIPTAPCEVVRMDEHEEKNSTIAYYQQPAADGSRPGRYYINTYMPETRPRYEAEALAYHESIPGHHLQIAIAQELQRLPDFRRFSGVTAFLEGWGLYTEKLADEMGLYSSDLDRMGMLSYDAWRACRLVVDTGMHAKKWTRQEAIDFMLQNTALAENNITNEVDRYITWPAQALAYKIGQLEILRLRDQCKRLLGSRFNIREFHDVVLGSGAVPLTVLREIADRYIADKKR